MGQEPSKTHTSVLGDVGKALHSPLWKGGTAMKGLKAVFSDKKVWVALVGLVAGIAVALGFNESLVATISGGVLSVVSVVLMALMGVKTAKTTTTQDPNDQDPSDQ